MYSTIVGNSSIASYPDSGRIRAMTIGKRLEGARLAAGYQYAADLARAAGRGKPTPTSTAADDPTALERAWSKLPRDQQAAMLDLIKRLAAKPKKK